MPHGSAKVTIRRPADDVFGAIADITRMGEWSPECIACRWIGGAEGPAVGARFEGDNVARIAGRTVKTWTTTSEVTTCEPGRVFEFIAEGYTTWRYELVTVGSATEVTESFDYAPGGFVDRYLYTMLLRRPAMMGKGMQRTLERVKAALEAER
jgi:uncharacterized protein YndB with AHSA1/START domain